MVTRDEVMGFFGIVNLVVGVIMCVKLGFIFGLLLFLFVGQFFVLGFGAWVAGFFPEGRSKKAEVAKKRLYIGIVLVWVAICSLPFILL